MTAIGKLRTVLSIGLALIPCIQAFTAERPALSTLDDYPTEVVTYVMKRFEGERDALREKGIPEDDDGIVNWEDCGPAINNAHKVYLQAFKAATLSEKRKALLEATAMPCFEFPSEGNGLHLDYLGDLRNGARILTNETVLCAAQGDTEGAVTMLSAGYGLLAHHARAPTMLVYLTRIACQGLLDEALRVTLATQKLSEGQLKRLDEAVALATRPDTLARVWLYEESTAPGTDPLDQLQTVYITEAESQAQLLLSRTAIAIERHLLEHGTLPDSLDAVVPTYLPTVPIDPLIGDALGYRKNDKSYAVYSVGKDGVAPENPLAAHGEASNSERTLLVLPVVKKNASRAEFPWSTLYEPDAKNSRKDERAIKAVFGVIDLRQTCGATAAVVLFAGPLDGGTTVLIDSCEDAERKRPVQAAFWVHDERIYVVNDWARELAGDLPESPSHIDFDTVRDVVR